jgi:hypothetical protein
MRVMRSSPTPGLAPSRSKALGKRVSKSRMPTHSGRMKTRAIRGLSGRRLSNQACPASSPKTRLVMAAYSGAMPSTVSVRTEPRTSSTLWGMVSLSIVSATFVPSRSACILGASGKVPSTISAPFQWNPMGTTRGVPSVQV